MYFNFNSVLLPRLQIFDYPTTSSITTFVLTKLAATARVHPKAAMRIRPPLPLPRTAAPDVADTGGTGGTEEQRSLLAAYTTSHAPLGDPDPLQHSPVGDDPSLLPHSPPMQRPREPRTMVAIAATVFRPLMSPGEGRGLMSALPSPNSLPDSDSILPIPLARWDRDPKAPVASTYPAPAIRGAQFGAFLSSVEAFDAAAFGLSLQEAVSMDPQHRLLLESASELWMQHKSASNVSRGMVGSGGGISADGSLPVGVYVGISWTEYHRLAEAHRGLEGSNAGGGPYAAQGAVLRYGVNTCPTPKQ